MKLLDIPWCSLIIFSVPESFLMVFGISCYWMVFSCALIALSRLRCQVSSRGHWYSSINRRETVNTPELSSSSATGGAQFIWCWLASNDAQIFCVDSGVDKNCDGYIRVKVKSLVCGKRERPARDSVPCFPICTLDWAPAVTNFSLRFHRLLQKSLTWAAGLLFRFWWWWKGRDIQES